MIATESIEVRNLLDTDVFALPLFPAGWKFDNEWCWLALEEGEIIAAVLAAPCHGIVIVQVVYAKQGKVLLRLLRKVFRDCHDRGFLSYMGYVNAHKKEQVKLLKVAVRAKAKVFPDTMVCFGGALLDALRW